MRPVLTHVALHVRDVEASATFYRGYCGLSEIAARDSETTDGRVVWLSEPGRERELIVVLIPGGPDRVRPEGDFGHLGFALGSRGEVDAVAARARVDGRLTWEPREEPFPVGYYCGISDPDGNVVEFSYGQPLGPGALDRDVSGQR